MRLIRRLAKLPRRIARLLQKARSDPSRLDASVHAIEGMARDCLERDDIIYAILRASRVEREPDETHETEWKYTVVGSLEDGFLVYTTGKVLQDEDGQDKYYLITAHAQDEERVSEVRQGQAAAPDSNDTPRRRW